MAGRNISASHVALTGTRVMLTTSVIGQAVGTAAAMCVQENKTPRDLGKENIAGLQQQLLKDGAHLIEVKNEDPNDLALKAKATASSEISPASDAINGFGRARLKTAYKNADMQLNAWVPDFSREETPWLQLEWNRPQTFNVIHVNFQSKELTPKSFEIQTFVEGQWKLWRRVENPLRNRRNVFASPVSGANKVRILLTDDTCKGGICEVRIYNEDKHTLNVVERMNNANMNDGTIKLPWE